MKVPYKIYLRQIPDQRVESFWYNKRGKFCDNHEYIRKDALLDWLESMIYQHNEDRFDDGFNTAIGQVIDKLNSM